jgi:hypothetical protein
MACSIVEVGYGSTMQMTSAGTRSIIDPTPRGLLGRGKLSCGLENNSRIDYAGQARY